MKPKKLPRLWCALQGLLPLEACLAAQRAELAWPRHEPLQVPPPRVQKRASSRAPGENSAERP
jgi:hypothetical protein